MRNLLLAALMAAGTMTGFTTLAAAAPTRDLGGLDLTAYCIQVYGSNYKAFLAAPQTAVHWNCVPRIHHVGTADHELFSQDMTAACFFEYRLIGVYAEATKWND